MKYYKLKSSKEISVVGEYPQCNPKLDIDPEGSSGYRKVLRNQFPEFLPNVELVLNSKAKWTDLLSTIGPSHGYIITNTMKLVLENCNIPLKAFYPLKIYHKNKCKTHFWFHFMNNDFLEWVDKRQSKLYLRSIFPDKHYAIINEADLSKSPQELLNLARDKPKFTNYYWEKLVFNKKFPNLDLFETPLPSMNTIISESLLEEFKKAGITGYETKDFCEVRLSTDV